MDKRVTSLSEFAEIKANPKNAGTVIPVSREVFEYHAKKLFIRPISIGEKNEIESLIRQPIKRDDYIGLTRTVICEKCKHEFSFADHYRSAIASGAHSPSDLAKFTSPSDNGHYYLAIDTDKPREIKCVACDEIIIVPHCCYTTSAYAYV